MKRILLIINGPAHGADETFNAIQLASALGRRVHVEVRVFLMRDAVTCAIAGQETPNGYCTLDRMVKTFARHGGQIACCGTCLDARGLGQGAPHRRGTPLNHGRTGSLDRRGRPVPGVLILLEAPSADIYGRERR